MKSKVLNVIIIFVVIFTIFSPNIAIATNSTKDLNDAPISIEEPTIESEAAFLMEVNTGNVLYSKNSSEKLYPASTTKIMTAILALENCELDELATVSKNAVELVPSGYTNAKLVPNEKMTVKDLLYALMLNSANEAANVLGEHISGTIEEFAKLMNEKAKEIGCSNTHFVNTNGIHDDNHYTTAEDLAKIAVYCMKNKTFREIVSTLEYRLPTTEQYTKDDRVMKNTNQLINSASRYYVKEAIGVKTGYTAKAGNCLVSYAVTDDGDELVCVTLKAGSSTDSTNQKFIDSKEVLEFGLENFSNRQIAEKGEVVKKIDVKNATAKTKQLKVVAKEEINDFILDDIDLSKTKVSVDLNEKISAPIEKGEKIGTITFEVNGKEYKTDAVAGAEVKRSYIFIFYIIIVLVILLAIVKAIRLRFKDDGYEDE